MQKGKTMVLKKPNFPKIPSKEILIWKYKSKWNLAENSSTKKNN